MATHGYAGRTACGCIVWVRVDDDEHPKAVARDVADAIERGMKIERRTIEDIKADPLYLPTKCPHTGRSWWTEDGPAPRRRRGGEGMIHAPTPSRKHTVCGLASSQHALARDAKMFWSAPDKCRVCANVLAERDRRKKGRKRP